MKLRLCIGLSLICFGLWGQEPALFRGQVINQHSLEVLPYANILVKGTQIGTVSNEQGWFSIKTDKLSPSDSIEISFIGYKTKTIAYLPRDTLIRIGLQEDLINLSETFVFGETPDAKTIIKNVVEQIKENHQQKVCSQQKAFVRERLTAEFHQVSMRLKKNSVQGFDKSMLKEIEQKIPKRMMSYKDVLSDLYFSDRENDSLKIDVKKAIVLEQEDINFSAPLSAVLQKMVLETNENEYWKIKSGIFSQRAELNTDVNDSSSVDTSKTSNSQYRMSNYSKARSIHDYFDFTKLKNTEDWSFLYQPDDYEYRVEHGTKVQGESVFVIDFVPKKLGKYQGRLFVSMETYAVLRADFKYAEGKQGFGFGILGIGYRKLNTIGSIWFEKIEGVYQAKYFAYNHMHQGSLNRNIMFVKKRKRWLFDKTVQEIKVKLSINAKIEDSKEVLILENKPITHQDWASFVPKDQIEGHFVNQFSDKYWKDYTIIEPTQTMRAYKKEVIP